MTIQEAINKIDRLKPNHVSDEDKIAWLSELDGMIHAEILMHHEHTEEQEEYKGYDGDTDLNQKLIAPFPYDEIYVHWLASNIDQVNLEIQKYNNDRALFNNAYDTLSDWWTRNFMPIQKVRELRL